MYVIFPYGIGLYVNFTYICNMERTEHARFDTRLPKEQKEFFEYAARLGGFRTLTDFVMFSVQERAKAIVEEHDRILASKSDQKIFFDALMNPKKPNRALKNAMSKYQEAIKSL